MNPNNVTIGLLIALLSHHSFPVRNAAQESLSRCGDVAQPYLQAALHHQDGEIAFRCREVWERNQQRWLDSLEPCPWIDALPFDYPHYHEIVKTYLSRPGDPPEYEGFREATRDWLRDRMAHGMTRAEAVELVGVMRERERFWVMNRRYPGAME